MIYRWAPRKITDLLIVVCDKDCLIAGSNRVRSANAECPIASTVVFTMNLDTVVFIVNLASLDTNTIVFTMNLAPQVQIPLFS